MVVCILKITGFGAMPSFLPFIEKSLVTYLFSAEGYTLCYIDFICLFKNIFLQTNVLIIFAKVGKKLYDGLSSNQLTSTSNLIQIRIPVGSKAVVGIFF